MGRATTIPANTAFAGLIAFLFTTCVVALSAAQPRTLVATCSTGCDFYREADGTLTKTVAAQATCGCTGLSLQSLNLTTIAPDAFAGLTSLQSLSLQRNELITAPSFAGLTALTRLGLSARIACFACGSLPADTNIRVYPDGLFWDADDACKVDCVSAAPSSIEPVSADMKAIVPLELTQKLRRQSQNLSWNNFGASVSMSGDMVAVMGGYYAAPRPQVDFAIFELSADRGWTQTARIPLFDVKADAYVDMSLSGGTLGVNVGNVVVIFVQNGTEWTRQENITLNDARVASFSLDGDSLVIADYRNRSSIHAYRRTASGVWAEEARIQLPETDASFQYLSTTIAVTLSGSTLVVSDTGIALKKENLCRILIFERDGAGVWTHQADVGSFIRQACPMSVWRTGLSLYGNTLAVGGGVRGPYTYVFARDAIGLWTLEANLTSVDTVPGDWLGYVISLHGDVLAISAEKDDDKGLNAGAVYIYTRADNIWTRSTKLLATDGTAGDRFGYGLTLGARTLVIGAYGVSDQGIDRGAAYVYSTSPKPNKSSAPMSDFENESSAPMSGYRCRVLLVALVMLLQFCML